MKDKVKYFHDTEIHNLDAPREIVPFIYEIFKPNSVVDVGCGLGTFLKVFSECGVNEITGFEGIWINEKKLHVPMKKVEIVDLETDNWAKGTFDIAISLEVAEHLKPSIERQFVKNLTSLSEVIIFSAALEGQGGQNHINEKPLESWIGIFNDFGYHFFDVFREKFWNSKNINWWYKQNMFLVLKEDSKWINSFNSYPKDFEIMSFVHPDCLRKSYINREILKKEYEKLSKVKAFDLTYILKRKIKSLPNFFKK